MILLSRVIDPFEPKLFQKYKTRLLSSHKKALMRMKFCRTQFSPQMRVRCTHEDCSHQSTIAHSCGHRNCPHCQHHESQQWIENQLSKQVTATYSLLTFTLPGEFRNLVRTHQRKVYSLLFSCVKEVVMTFTKNDKRLQGHGGFTAVLHTHAGNPDFHPHLHVVMPGAAVDQQARLWRVKTTTYLFDRRALAEVFRAKFLQALTEARLRLPFRYPAKWVVHCKSVGNGKKAIIYLGNYLYKGVIQERHIIRCENGEAL